MHSEVNRTSLQTLCRKLGTDSRGHSIQAPCWQHPGTLHGLVLKSLAQVQINYSFTGEVRGQGLGL